MAGDDLVLAIDLGTSGPKVALVTMAGAVVDADVERTRLILTPDGGAEQDPREWWDAVSRASRRLLARHPGAPVAAVATTAQWSGTVAVDADGEPIGNAIIWMDTRGAPDVARVTRGLVRIDGYGLRRLATWIRLTGGVPGRAGKDSIAHVLWLARERPDVYAAAHRLLEPKDYLNLRLTGRAAASFDSIALHWVTDNRDPRRVRYHDKLIAWSGLDRAKLPALMPATTVLGALGASAADDLGAIAGVPVVVGSPDVPSAAVGSGATRDYEAHLYLGTSSWITCHVPFKRTDLRRGIASLPSAIPGRYFVADEQEAAGHALTFARDLFLPGEGAEAFARLDKMAAAALPGSGGVVFAPWLVGERTPVDDRLVRAGFHNLSARSTRDDLVRAVLEGVALNTRWLLDSVEAFLGRRLDPIRVIGGGARSDVWCAIHADVLGRTLEPVADPVNANARGAAIIAAVALGRATFEDAARRIPVARAHVPDPARRRTYDRQYAAFRDVYRANRAIHHRLNGGIA